MKTSLLTHGIRRLAKKKYCGVVILAAGSATRMYGVDKIMADLDGEPVIVRTVRTFVNCQRIREIVVVTRPDLIPAMTEMLADFPKVKAVVAGGATRQESASMGMAVLSEDVTLCGIHDGARPLVSEEVIMRTLLAAETYGAAMPVIPVKDTIKVEKGGLVDYTPDRSKLRAGQTPQFVDYDLLRGAVQKAKEDGYTCTDEACAVEHMGMSVKLVDGDERNIKITTQLDLKIARLFLEETE